MKFSQWLAKKLPARLVYFATVRLLAETTTGEWSSTEVVKLTGMEALKRYADKHKL